MKLTVVFMLVTLALRCYSASAVLDMAGSLVSNVVPNMVPNLVSVPFSVLTDLVGGVQGCVNQLTPKVLSALNRALGILKIRCKHSWRKPGKRHRWMNTRHLCHLPL
ncbi:secretoglobin family 3A member 2-like [Dermochelys coriacea]|uniref:secretoglobin family 3A member 2-like n=1 Tax=Dermochelys coriacea TaxID=27794 RepID=UPI0018E8BF96|nr:secretoglobin family 3A member 2-like [Dermochelys coriacea]